MRRCRVRGWLIAEDEIDPLDPDVVLERLGEVTRFGKGELHTGNEWCDVLWDKMDGASAGEYEEARIDAHVYLARYGRIDPSFWERRETSERRAYVERLSELVKRENEAASRNEDR